MLIVRFELVPDSLFSMRVAFTWQAAMSYPMPPPSVIAGMMANALWEAGKYPKPTDALEDVREKLAGVWVSLRSEREKEPGHAEKNDKPVMAASYATVTTWFYDNVVKSNILPRQFLFSRDGFRVFVASEDGEFLGRVKEALGRAPVYLGDSEGLVSVMDIQGPDSAEPEQSNGQARPVSVYFRDSLSEDNGIVEGEGTLYWVNERALLPGSKKEDMVAYLFPVVQRGKSFMPRKMTVRFKKHVNLIRAFGEVLPLGT